MPNGFRPAWNDTSVPVIVVLAISALSIAAFGVAAPAQADQASIVSGEIAAFAKQLGENPDMAIDLTGVSGEYCFNGGIGKGGHMTHYAVDTESTQEDVIDFVNARSLIEAGVVNPDALPPHPGKLGAMTPNQWYYLAPGTFEPHHGRKFPFPMMIRATNLE